jgi:predicted metalloprotease with PDZ domain
VSIEVHGAPEHFHLAMKVHAEYDAAYWRYISDLRVEPAMPAATLPAVERSDSTLWTVTLPGGSGVIRYRVHIQPPPKGPRRAWLPVARPDGALLNPPDFFLYIPELANAPVMLHLAIPRSWRVATALHQLDSPAHRSAPDAVTLLDSPIMLGALHQWDFCDGATSYHVAYWPLLAAPPPDSLALVDALQRLVHEAAGVFGRGPAPDYWFLIQDGASDALEHAASVTIGAPGVSRAMDPRASLFDIAHEFFHTWNLVAIRPLGFNELSYRAPARTPSLWLGEGVTLYYADALVRRAGLADTSRTRLDHLGALAARYLAIPAIRSTSPERASLAFEDSPLTNPDATSGYYLQGELLGDVIDALVRDSTRETRGLDDVMRALFSASQRPGYRGYAPADVERSIDSVCDCNTSTLFRNQIRGTGPIAIASVVERLGLTMETDSVLVTDSAGNPSPDLRLGVDFPDAGAPARLIINNPATAWARAGFRTGDVLESLNGATPRSYQELRQVLGALRVGSKAEVDVVRDGAPVHIRAEVASYFTPRVRFTEQPGATVEQHRRRAQWLGAW